MSHIKLFKEKHRHVSDFIKGSTGKYYIYQVLICFAFSKVFKKLCSEDRLHTILLLAMPPRVSSQVIEAVKQHSRGA